MEGIWEGRKEGVSNGRKQGGMDRMYGEGIGGGRKGE